MFTSFSALVVHLKTICSDRRPTWPDSIWLAHDKPRSDLTPPDPTRPYVTRPDPTKLHLTWPWVTCRSSPWNRVWPSTTRWRCLTMTTAARIDWSAATTRDCSTSSKTPGRARAVRESELSKAQIIITCNVQCTYIHTYCRYVIHTHRYSYPWMSGKWCIDAPLESILKKWFNSPAHDRGSEPPSHGRGGGGGRRMSAPFGAVGSRYYCAVVTTTGGTYLHQQPVSYNIPIPPFRE